jgi:hypothetical protein
MKHGRLSWPSPLRQSLASGSVVLAWILFERLSWRKLRSPLRPPAGGAPEPSFDRQLFIPARAFNSVRSAEKCSPDRSRLTRGNASKVARNSRATSASKSRSRFFENVDASYRRRHRSKARRKSVAAGCGRSAPSTGAPSEPCRSPAAVSPAEDIPAQSRAGRRGNRAPRAAPTRLPVLRPPALRSPATDDPPRSDPPAG